MPSARPVLLFVDDERPFLDGLRRSFAREPYDCRFAASFDEALAALEADRVDAVICDERFPGRSGWELLSEIKRVYPRAMRLMLTGAASMASTVAGINQAQVFRLLLKPCSHEMLVGAIAEALEHQALHDRLRQALVYLTKVNRAVEVIAERHPAEHREALRELAVGAPVVSDDAERIEREIDERIGAMKVALGETG
jgi:two-component system response regulator HupR/HoxA